MNNDVVLVDALDNIIGYQEKNLAHINGSLHRAVSVFIFNSKGEWLLQRRSFSKYHSPGLWSNACCTHPFPGESNLQAAKRRVKEELGMEINVEERFRIIYDFSLDNGMREHELDTIYIAVCDKTPMINKDEIHEYRYITLAQIEKKLSNEPFSFTCWFKQIFRRVDFNI
ncbi:MAG: isopentenyl-diphosphate Delta-isomerase [Bacteroidales bacterium]|nr:isopentenyl-diphosphate Delta-isomerase [Bacteroidales bacterium]